MLSSLLEGIDNFTVVIFQNNCTLLTLIDLRNISVTSITKSLWHETVHDFTAIMQRCSSAGLDITLKCLTLTVHLIESQCHKQCITSTLS